MGRIQGQQQGEKQAELPPEQDPSGIESKQDGQGSERCRRDTAGEFVDGPMEESYDRFGQSNRTGQLVRSIVSLQLKPICKDTQRRNIRIAACLGEEHLVRTARRQTKVPEAKKRGQQDNQKQPYFATTDTKPPLPQNGHGSVDAGLWLMCFHRQNTAITDAKAQP